MRKKLIGFAVVFSLALGVTAAIAYSEALDQAKARYPSINGTRLDTCQLCHTGQTGGALNAYGLALKGNDFNFAALEGADSDGDGFTDLEEILALTFPGDPSDFPSGGGGGGGDGEETIVARGSLGSYESLGGLAAATDTARDEALVAWIDTVAEARAGSSVGSWLVDVEGQPLKKAVTLDGGDVDPEQGLGVAYGKKRFLAAWRGSEGELLGRVVKAKKGKALKGVVEIAEEAGEAAAVGWDDANSLFLVAGALEDGVAVDEVSTKGKVVSPSLTRYARHLVPEMASPQAFAAGALDDGVVLLGASGNAATGMLAPFGVLLRDGSPEHVGQPFRGASKKPMQARGAFNDDQEGIAAWRLAKKVFTAPLGVDGDLTGKSSKVKGAKAGAIGVARQSDGSFLVVWTHLKKNRLMAIGTSADGKETTKAIELQGADEEVVTDFLAVTPLGDDVLVVYATRGDEPEIRTVVVGLR